MTTYSPLAAALLLAAAEDAGAQSVPQWAFWVGAVIAMPLGMKVVDAIWSKATKADEKDAAARKEMADAQARGIESIRKELHDLAVALPTMLAAAKHDAVNAVTPKLLDMEVRVRSIEEIVARMDERTKGAA